MQSINISRDNVYLEFLICFSIAKYKTISFHNVRHPISISRLFAFPKLFLSARTVKIDVMLISFRFCSEVNKGNRYRKGIHTEWATKRSIIGYDDTEDTICKT